MNWRSILATSASMAVGIALLTGAAAQQQQPRPQPQPQAQPQPPKPMKEEIVGSWRLLIVDGIRADGTKVPIYGPNPKGLAMFAPDGRYTITIMRDTRPKFAANDRLKGTPEEIKAAFDGGLAHFGTYTVNEADKSFTIRIEGSTYPNWDGTTQKRTITALAGDDFTWTNPTTAAPSAAGTSRVDLAWRRVK